jgi:hypothetical protein
LTDPNLYATVTATGRSPKKYEAWLAGVLRSSLIGD